MSGMAQGAEYVPERGYRANRRAMNAYYEATKGPTHHTLPDGRRDN